MTDQADRNSRDKDEGGSSGQRERILRAALPHIPFDGWTLKAARAGAVDLGQSPDAADIAFADGPEGMLATWSRAFDTETVRAMEEAGVSSMPVRERIATGIRLRLEIMAPHREAAARAVALMALPSGSGLGARLMYRTVDAIWYAAGDTSTDFSFYTRRGLLAAVWTSSVLCWLNDESEDFAATRAFIDRRIAEVLQVPKLMDRIGKGLGGLARPPGRRRGWRRRARA